MPQASKSRFAADTFVRLVARRDQGRLEMEFDDAAGRRHVLSLPLETAVALARLICDSADATPFLEKSR